MKSKLIATSALAVVLAFGAAPAGTAFAQDTRQPSAVFNPDAERFPSRDGYYAANPSLILASDLIGKTLYSGAANNAESIGDVNDVIMGQNGDAQAIIIGVGGFLGIGEKDVAVDFSQVNWQVDANGNRVLVTALTKESLENAPSFDYALLERDYNRLTWGDPRVDGQGMQGQDMAARQPVTNDGTAVAPAQPGAAQPMGTTAQQQPVQRPADDAE